MKNTKIIITCFLTVLSAACSDSDNTIDQVLDGKTSGGIFRTISVNNATFNFSDPSVEWSLTVEAQDEQNGDLLSSVNVYASLYRTTVVDGVNTVNIVGSEAMVKNVPASAFETGEDGLPRGTINVSLGEVVNALGLSSGDYLNTDEVRVRLEYVMTNGKTWTNTDAGGTVLTSSFFKSPYIYSVQFFCALSDASLFAGDYKVTTDVWADYAEGDVVPISYNAEDGDYSFRILATNNPYLNNPDTSYMLVTINPDDGTVTVSSNEDFDYGNLVVPVTGTGSVGTCTGTIDLTLDFGSSYTGNQFSLVKQ